MRRISHLINDNDDYPYTVCLLNKVKNRLVRAKKCTRNSDFNSGKWNRNTVLCTQGNMKSFSGFLSIVNLFFQRKKPCSVQTHSSVAFVHSPVCWKNKTSINTVTIHVCKCNQNLTSNTHTSSRTVNANSGPIHF